MQTVHLRDDQLQFLAEESKAQATSIDELVSQAVERYIQFRCEQQLDREIAAFERMHQDLWQRYPGQWVAIHGGQLIDRDADHAALYHRVRDRLGQTVVLIRQVTASPHPEFVIRGPRIASRPR